MNTIADMEKAFDSVEGATHIKSNPELLKLLFIIAIESRLLSRLKRKIKKLQKETVAYGDKTSVIYSSGFSDAIYNILKIIKETQYGKRKNKV